MGLIRNAFKSAASANSEQTEVDWIDPKKPQAISVKPFDDDTKLFVTVLLSAFILLLLGLLGYLIGGIKGEISTVLAGAFFVVHYCVKSFDVRRAIAALVGIPLIFSLPAGSLYYLMNA